MSDRKPQSKLELFRFAMWIPGLFFLWMWWQAFKPVVHLASVPCESIVPQQYMEAGKEFHEIEEIFRVAAIVCLTLSIEGTILALGWFKQVMVSWRIDSLFKSEPDSKNPAEDMPELVTADIDACVTPNLREPVSLRNFQKLQQYCSFARLSAKRGDKYPPLVFVSARAQEYTELLCQTLDIINVDDDVPCVLENGMALYYPAKRTVEPLIDETHRTAMASARDLLVSKLRDKYEFEPKDFMITINVDKQREEHNKTPDPVKARNDEIFELRKRVVKELEDGNLKVADYDITSSGNAVDIVAAGVNKWTGLQKVMEKSRRTDKMKIVSIGNSDADNPVLQEVGRAFCSLDAMPAIQITILRRDPQRMIKEWDSAAVVVMLERVTGVRLN